MSREQYLTDLSTTLRAALTLRQMTYRDLAKQVGVQPSTVLRWANAQTEMRSRHLAGTARALRIDPLLLVYPIGDWGEALRRLAADTGT